MVLYQFPGFRWCWNPDRWWQCCLNLSMESWVWSWELHILACHHSLAVANTGVSGPRPVGGGLPNTILKGYVGRIPDLRTHVKQCRFMFLFHCSGCLTTRNLHFKSPFVALWHPVISHVSHASTYELMFPAFFLHYCIRFSHGEPSNVIVMSLLAPGHSQFTHCYRLTLHFSPNSVCHLDKGLRRKQRQMTSFCAAATRWSHTAGVCFHDLGGG